MKFIMIGLLLREALDRLCVRLNMYLVFFQLLRHWGIYRLSYFLRVSFSTSNHHFSFVFGTKLQPSERSANRYTVVPRAERFDNHDSRKTQLKFK